jgi:hypothetical protein
MKSNLKSQAALEFLTTYAWAFLVILIMIGALAYFGILSPSRLLPDRCNFGSEITCDKAKMIVNNVNDNTLAMELKSSFGEAVVVTVATVTTDNNVAGACTAQINDAAIVNFAWGSGDTITFNADCATGTAIASDEKIKFEIEVDYYAAAAGSAYTKTIFGDLVTSTQ